MQLSTRLFLFVAVLLAVISLAAYLVPLYILRSHIQQTRQDYLAQVEQERARNRAHYTLWLADEMAVREATINAFLFLLSGHSSIRTDLLQEGKITESVWIGSARLLAFSSQLTFLQATQGDTNAAITLSRTNLYLARQFSVTSSLSWIAIGSFTEPKERYLYLGIWLPDPEVVGASVEKQEKETGTPRNFLLFDPIQVYNKGSEYVDRLGRYEKWIEGEGKGTPEVAHQISRNLFQRLEAARQYLIQEFGDPSPENEKNLRFYVSTYDRNFPENIAGMALPQHLRAFLQQGAHPTAFGGVSLPSDKSTSTERELTPEQFYSMAFLSEVQRMNDLELITALGYLSSTGAIYRSPFDYDTPVGAARLLADLGEGTAVMSSQAFSDRSLFDAPGFLQKHPGTAEGAAIGSDFGLVDEEVAGALTVVNVVRLSEAEPNAGDTYLTLGASLNQVLNRLAQISGQTSFLLHQGKVVDQIDLSGSPTRTIATSVALEGKVADIAGQGFITLDGAEYYYSQYVPNADWDIFFLTLEPAEYLLAPVKRFEQRSRELTLEVSKQIITIAFGIFILGLLFLELLARHFTRPITMLAEATKKVAEGKYESIDLPKAPPQSRNEIVILTRAFAEMIAGLRDREKLRAVLNKVVSKEIADEILRGKVHLGGEVREVTVLFADIRGFTQITEKLPPDEVIVFINSYMTVMTEIIEAYQGVIDKYVGDEVMALFGAPLAHPYSALQGILAALVMRQKLQEWNQERATLGLVAADVGIGIHTGSMVAGNMGAEDRLNYTVMGANVNLAARLCQEAEGKEILVAEQMLQQPKVQETLLFEEKTVRTFKGFSDPIKVYRVVGLQDESRMEELSAFVRQFGPTTQGDQAKGNEPS